MSATARRIGRYACGVAAAVGLLATGGVVWMASQGISARSEPGRFETAVARAARHLLIPSSERNRPNPEPASAAALESGLEHFADHCASCHANDGSGNTELGRSLYPRPPDLRLAPTQGLGDGELFYIIEHGVRLTGMPAFGTGSPEGRRSSWELVHFLRRLPALTDDELERMRALNPRSAAQWREEEAERRFLAGDRDPSTAETTAHQPGGPHR